MPIKTGYSPSCFLRSCAVITWRLIIVLNQQVFDILFRLEHNIAWQGDFHELQHGGVIVISDLCAIEAFVVRAQVPEMGEHVVRPEDLVRSNSFVTFCAKRSLK